MDSKKPAASAAKPWTEGGGRREGGRVERREGEREEGGKEEGREAERQGGERGEGGRKRGEEAGRGREVRREGKKQGTIFVNNYSLYTTYMYM